MAVFICLQIAFFPNLVFASTVGGWTLSNPVAQGASTVYSGLKNVLVNGKNIAVAGSATIAPAAANVAKVLARGGAAYALSFAVEQLLGSVEWVLDPANNRIKYTNPVDESNPTGEYIWKFNKFISSFLDNLVSAKTLDKNNKETKHNIIFFIKTPIFKNIQKQQIKVNLLLTFKKLMI